jgi:hypothetical protein
LEATGVLTSGSGVPMGVQRAKEGIVNIEEFLITLQRLTADMILAAADDLDEQASTAAGEVAWWRATVEIDRLLRLHRVGRRAALAASQAAAAVTAAAISAGLDLADRRVTAVARAAADVARGLTAESTAVQDLLDGCKHLVAA